MVCLLRIMLDNYPKRRLDSFASTPNEKHLTKENPPPLHMSSKLFYLVGILVVLTALSLLVGLFRIEENTPGAARLSPLERREHPLNPEIVDGSSLNVYVRLGLGQGGVKLKEGGRYTGIGCSARPVPSSFIRYWLAERPTTRRRIQEGTTAIEVKSFPSSATSGELQSFLILSIHPHEKSASYVGDSFRGYLQGPARVPLAFVDDYSGKVAAHFIAPLKGTYKLVLFHSFRYCDAMSDFPNPIGIDISQNRTVHVVDGPRAMDLSTRALESLPICTPPQVGKYDVYDGVWVRCDIAGCFEESRQHVLAVASGDFKQEMAWIPFSCRLRSFKDGEFSKCISARHDGIVTVVGTSREHDWVLDLTEVGIVNASTRNTPGGIKVPRRHAFEYNIAPGGSERDSIVRFVRYQGRYPSDHRVVIMNARPMRCTHFDADLGRSTYSEEMKGEIPLFSNHTRGTLLLTNVLFQALYCQHDIIEAELSDFLDMAEKYWDKSKIIWLRPIAAATVSMPEYMPPDYKHAVIQRAYDERIQVVDAAMLREVERRGYGVVDTYSLTSLVWESFRDNLHLHVSTTRFSASRVIALLVANMLCPVE